MTFVNVKFKDWSFEVDRELTKQTYNKIKSSGAEDCVCSNCKNYVAYRDKVFPNEIKQLFIDLGIDYRKEVEIYSLETLPNGLIHIQGWFHFKGKVLSGKNYLVPLPNGGFTYDMTDITDNFSIGFAEGNDLAYFEDRDGLVQLEFSANIPWVIDKKLNTNK